MAASVVQSAKATGNTPATIALTGVTAGNALVLLVSQDNGTATPSVSSDSAGDTWPPPIAQKFPASDGALYFFVLGNAKAGTHTLTLSNIGPYNARCLIEVSGVTTSPYDAAVTAGANLTGPPHTLATGTPSTANTFLLAALESLFAANPLTESAATGWTFVSAERNNNDWYGNALWSKSLTSAAADSVTWTASPSLGAAALLVIGLKVDAGGGGGDVTVGLTGVAGSGAAGSMTNPANETSKGITGNAGTGAIGALGKTRAKGLTGLAATAAIGSMTNPANTLSKVLAGVSGAGAVGTVTAGSGGLVVALSGVSAAGSAGVLGKSKAATLAGNAAVGQVGAVAVAGAAPAGRLGGFEMSGVREVSFKPLMQRILEARADRVKPKKERAAKRAKVIEIEAAEVALEQGSETRFRDLMAMWLAQRPQLPPAADPTELFLAQVLFRIRQMEFEARARGVLQAAQQDEEDALIALLS